VIGFLGKGGHLGGTKKKKSPKKEGFTPIIRPLNGVFLKEFSDLGSEKKSLRRPVAIGRVRQRVDTVMGEKNEGAKKKKLGKKTRLGFLPLGKAMGGDGKSLKQGRPFWARRGGGADPSSGTAPTVDNGKTAGKDAHQEAGKKKQRSKKSAAIASLGTREKVPRGGKNQGPMREKKTKQRKKGDQSVKLSSGPPPGGGNLHGEDWGGKGQEGRDNPGAIWCRTTSSPGDASMGRETKRFQKRFGGGGIARQRQRRTGGGTMRNLFT